ncbi:MAG: matrixin family metalloprotease, partial [Bacteroidota bacterium]
IEFEELPENSESDIKFYVADIIQSGIGYPNYTDFLCGELAGNVLIQSNLSINECEAFYLFALHETGHTLGLGHVTTSNIMSPNFFELDLQGLQRGDISGIKAIYGEK